MPEPVSFTSFSPIETIAAEAIANAQGEGVEDYHYLDAQAALDALQSDGYRIVKTMYVKHDDIGGGKCSCGVDGCDDD